MQPINTSPSNLALDNTALTPQLPIPWYTNARIYALEQAHLFHAAPKYVGHALMIPNYGDYYALDWMNNAKALVNEAGNISLVSNVCRHRQAVILKGRGNTQQIVCPLHRWTYGLDGKLLGAPLFDENPCLDLEKTKLNQWHGLLFEHSDTHANIAQILEKLACKSKIDFTGYQFDRARIDHYQFNWKTFIEVYLEDYHVGPFHPGLNQFVDCDNLSWDLGVHFSAQTVGFKDLAHQHMSPTYQRWQNAVKQFHGANAPKNGAIWFVFYPFLMIEWYPQCLVVSHLIPTGVNTCCNVVEFYYPEEITLFEPEYIAAQQAAYVETALEDEEICQRMSDGRQALAAQQLNQTGPYQHPLETGLAHFHAWYRTQMEAHVMCTK